MEDVKVEFGIELSTTICRLCLATNRRLYDASCVMPTFGVVTGWERAQAAHVCWECRARLLSVQRLQRQATRAQLVLDHARSASNVIAIQCISSLTHVTKLYYDNVFTHTQELSDTSDQDKPDVQSPFLSSDDETLIKYKKIFITEKFENSNNLTDVTSVNNSTKKRKKKKMKKINIQKEKVTEKDANEFIEAFTVTEEELVDYRLKCANTVRMNRSVYKCMTCIRDFVREDTLEKHKVLLHSEAGGPHECEVCKCRFKTEALLTTHHSSHYILLRCLRDDCSFVHDSRRVMNTHQTIHNNVKAAERYRTDRFECDYCGKNFDLRGRLRAHIKTHRKLAMCEICGHKANDKCALRMHMLCHQDPSHRQFECHTCNKRFRTRYQLGVHTRLHTGERFICDVCGWKFTDIHSLKYHNQVKHIDGVFIPKRTKQPRTKSSFSYCHSANRDDLLETSSRVKLTEDNYYTEIAQTNSYKCGICYNMLTYNELHTHYVDVHKRKSRKCLDCNKTFKYHSLLLKHLKDLHTSERPHKCSICSAAFKTKPVLQNHMNLHSEVKAYKCDICAMTFRYKSGLYQHKFLHKGVKPHECTTCGVKFLYKSNLTGHMKVHTKERPYECEICGKRFPWKRNLKNHLNVHEKQHQTSLTSLQ